MGKPSTYDIIVKLELLIEEVSTIKEHLSKINGTVQTSHEWIIKNNEMPDQVKALCKSHDKLDRKIWKTGVIIGLLVSFLTFVGPPIFNEVTRLIFGR